MDNQMLCYRCSSAKNGVCCNDTVGACGKSAETSRLQDELCGALIGLAKASNHKSVDAATRRLIVEGLAATAAHTDFDNEHIAALTEAVRAAKTRFIPKFGAHNTSLKLPDDFDIRKIWQKSPEIRSLKSLLLFGVGGIALYAYESLALGREVKEATAFFHKALIALGANHFKEDYYAILKEMGDIAARVMAAAEKARQTKFGAASPTQVRRAIEPGPFIVVSGSDLAVFNDVLTEARESGVAVYSHGEALSAHAYPELRKNPMLKGHYGTGPQNQQAELDNIPAAIIFTSDQVAPPLPSYADRVFTAGVAHLPGCPYLTTDISPALIAAIQAGGAPEQVSFPGVNGGTELHTGFGPKSLRTVGYKLAAALAEGKLRRILVIGGVDGPGDERAYYTGIARDLPADTAIVTWGSIKYRFNDIGFNTVEGLPRVIDLGMEGNFPNVVALLETVAESARKTVAELPVTFHYVWEDQRSVAQLFAILNADIHDVILGPSLPPFITDEVWRTLSAAYGVRLLHDEDTVAPPEQEAVAATGDETTEPVTAASDSDDGVVAAEETDAAATETDGTDVEDRAAAAGLPAWADDEDVDEDATDDEAIETESDGAYVEFEEVTTAKESDEEAANDVEPPAALALPKGKGVSGWHDPDDEDDPYHLSEKEPYRYTPPKELVEIEAPPPISLPPGAGISGFAADKDLLPNDVEEETTLYHFAEALPEIKIPKGKGVSGWKEEDDFVKASPAKDDAPTEKPWLKKSLERLHAEVEADNKAAEPIPSAVDEAAQKAAKEKEAAAKEAEIAAKNSNKPWLEESLRALKASIEEDEADADAEKSAKPWLEASLKALHAEVEADKAKDAPAVTAADGDDATTDAPDAPDATADATAKEDEDTYTSSYRHDAAAAAEKPWLKSSIEELKASIDRDSGIKSVRKEDAPADEAAATWQDNTETKSWKDIAPAAGNSTDGAIVDATVDATPPTPADAPPSGGAEPPHMWQKPPVTPKPWDENLSKNWSKPEVLPKPWQAPMAPQANGNTAEAAPPTPTVGEHLGTMPASLGEQQTEAAGQAAMAQQIAARQQAAQQQLAAEQQRLQNAENELADGYAALAAAKAEQERFAAELQQQGARLAEARRQQEIEIARIERETAEIRQMLKDQERNFHRRSLRNRQEQAAFAAQLEREAEHLYAARATQEAYRQQLEAEAAQMAAAEREQAIRAARLQAEEARLQQLSRTGRGAATFGSDEGAPVLPADAGVSGYRQNTFTPGVQPPAPDPTATIVRGPQQASPTPPTMSGGTSGSRYHEELPAIQTDYAQTCYGVPQTPKVPLPAGQGISGWSAVDHGQAGAPAGTASFFAFMDSDAPATVKSDTEIITPGSGDEFIATKTPDGEIVLTVRTDKDKK